MALAHEQTFVFSMPLVFHLTCHEHFVRLHIAQSRRSYTTMLCRHGTKVHTEGFDDASFMPRWVAVLRPIEQEAK